MDVVELGVFLRLHCKVFVDDAEEACGKQLSE
jgi:hypothetical protein